MTIPNLPKLSKLSTASQLSLLAIVILLGAVFFTVNSALQEQTSSSSHASITTYASISLRGHTVATNKGTNSLVITVPTNRVAGDLLLAQVVVHGASTSITAPSGWTLVRKDKTGTSLVSAIYRRKATGTEKTFTWKFSSAQYASGGISDLANANTNGTTNPVEASSGKYNFSTTSMTAPAVSTTTTADELLFFGAVDASVSVTQPTGMTTSWTAKTTKNTSYMARQKLTKSGSTGTRTAKSSIKASNVSQLVAIKPKPIVIIPTATPTTKPGQPTNTPTPSHSPSVSPSQSPSVSPSPSQSPSVSPSVAPSVSPSAGPTDTPAPGSTLIKLTVNLHGIGSGGDSANPSAQGNNNPKHPTRGVTVEVYDAQNQLVTSQQGNIIFNKNSGKFVGTINLGPGISTGLYTIKVKSDQYLRALADGIQTITSGKINNVTVTLVVGDVNNDNQINIVDYNMLIGCYSDLLPPVDCPSGNEVATDLNDDGHVNQFDYNLFLRELSNVGGQ